MTSAATATPSGTGGQYASAIALEGVTRHHHQLAGYGMQMNIADSSAAGYAHGNGSGNGTANGVGQGAFGFSPDTHHHHLQQFQQQGQYYPSGYGDRGIDRASFDVGLSRRLSGPRPASGPRRLDNQTHTHVTTQVPQSPSPSPSHTIRRASSYNADYDYAMQNPNAAGGNAPRYTRDSAAGSRPPTGTATMTPVNEGGGDPDTGEQDGPGAETFHAHSPSPYEHAQHATTTTTGAFEGNTNANTNANLNLNDRQRRYVHPQASSSSSPGPSPYLRESFRQSKDDSGVFTTDMRSTADAPADDVDEPSATPGPTTTTRQHLQNVNLNGNSSGSGMPKHPSFSPSPGGTPTRDIPPRHSPIIPSSVGPAYKPTSIPISTSIRAVAQQPTYITPPSSPTPIAVNPVYTYASDATPRYGGQQSQQQQQAYRPSNGYPTPPEGKEICVECAMRDQEMADIDVTSPGVWDRESDILYHELCRQEAEEEERARGARTPNSSSENHPVVFRPGDPNRPRARGNRLTEPNLKLWNSMNPKEPHARQQNVELYIKTQTALLEAEALARARALQESRILENKLKDTYNHLRQSTYDVSSGATAVDENGLRLKTTSSHGQKRSVSGPTPISLGPIALDGTAVGNHGRHHQSQSREVTLLENGMIVEQVDVRKEERERRREEKRERSRARKSSRGSGGDRNNGEVISMYSAANSPLPYQTEFYTGASNGSGPVLAGRERGERPMSLSQSSTRATSVLTTPQPLTPPPGSAPGSARPPNTRVHSQVSLVDSQSISSASLSANRRSKFFAFRNWSEAWKSRDSFAPSGVMSLSGSMMDMHLALDRERQAMHTRPTTVDLGSNAPSIRHSQIFPRRASVSVDRDVPDRGMMMDRPKKKKGLAKIWGMMVKGSRASKNEAAQRAPRDVVQQPVERAEDDTPLAPPPPLSYLVNRTPRERSMSNASRRTSVPPSNSAPPTATLPTPTSIRNTWLEDMPSSRQVGGMLPAHTEESHSNAYGGAEYKSGQNPNGEPEMRQRMQESVSTQTQGPVINTPGSPRPISVYSLHKSLPPLPNEVPAGPSVSQSMPTPVDLDSPRPMTMYDMNTNAYLSPQSAGDMNVPEGLSSPQSYFRRDVRRQSFGGLTSRPDLSASGTFPLSARGNTGTRPGTGLGVPQDSYGYSPYAEMGSMSTPMNLNSNASRSVGRLGLAGDDSGRFDSFKSVEKRRSRFGLLNLLGKMTGGGGHGASRTSMHMNGSNSDARLSLAVPHIAPGPPTSESEQHQDGSPSATGEFGMGNGGGSSRSRHNGYISPAQPSRMSLASRRAIEELVDQDPKFVAYRYPSVEQNITLLR